MTPLKPTSLKNPTGKVPGWFWDESGVALFVVLWVVTLLIVVAGQFGFAVRHEIRSLRQFKESTEAAYIAGAGLSRGLYELLKDRSPGEEIDIDEDGEVVPDWRINTDIPPVAFSNGRFRVRIDNTSGRINLNTAGDALLRLMLNRTELSDIEKAGIVDAILDWRDADDLHRLNGAESDYYQTLPLPYNSKNGNFDTVDELLFVKGITPEIYHGVIRELVTVINDPKADTPSIRTALRRRGNSDSQRININAAPGRPAVPARNEPGPKGCHCIVSHREGLQESGRGIGYDRGRGHGSHIPFYFF